MHNHKLKMEDLAAKNINYYGVQSLLVKDYFYLSLNFQVNQLLPSIFIYGERM